MNQEGIQREFTQCPVCGSENRLGQELAKRNPPKNAPPGAPPGAKMLMTLNQQLIPLSQPLGLLVGKVLVVMTDYCLDCGAGYLVLVSEQMGHIDIKPREQK